MSSHINTFIDYCRKLEDPRVPGLITYPLEEMLLLSLCGILSGHNDWHDISYWGRTQITLVAVNFSPMLQAFLLPQH